VEKVVIDLTMSLDGFIAGPGDGVEHPLGTRGGMHLFDWYTSGTEPLHNARLFRPEGVNRDIVDRMYAELGAAIFGRRTYDITHGWGGSFPVNDAPLFILTHTPPPPAQVPRGTSTITFITDGIEHAVAAARAAAGGKTVSIGGASAGQQALRAGLVDEILVHVAPYLLGAGVRLFGSFEGDGIALEKLDVVNGLLATHLHYRVRKV
jgi:dihydrofolate reductase